MVILVDKSVFLWVSVEDRIIMDPDLNNIPCGTECLLGKPETGKFENDITNLSRLDGVKVDALLLCVEDLGRLETITRHRGTIETRRVGTLDHTF